jgi:8-oxo-dGTP pyrophosphatase MutT (NUDIX family)
MDPELSTFLESRIADFSQQLVWRGGEHRLQLRGYFTTDPPPDAFVLAGRALVIDDQQVLVVQDGDGEHILPGGRRESGESAVDAVYREVIEETGWSISNPTVFSVIHLHHETPEPVNVGRIIYPDFLWHVFIAKPLSFDPRARHTDGYELGAAFRPIAKVLQQSLEPFQRILLEAAVRACASRAT